MRAAIPILALVAATPSLIAAAGSGGGTAASAPEAATGGGRPEQTATAAAAELESILREQKEFFDFLQKNATAAPATDATTGATLGATTGTAAIFENAKELRARSLMARYENFIAAHPDEPAVIVLYAKFLRLIDARELANRWFEKADKLLPDTAVIKEQLGAFAAEEGRPAQALPLLERAVALAPETAVYHYRLGEFLAACQPALVAAKTLTRAECDARMLAAFAAAARLAPGEAGYAWRHAESFLDCEKPNWVLALAAWDKIAARTEKPLLREAVSLHRARALIGLGRKTEARRLLSASRAPELSASRARLSALLAKKEEK
ncbi:MAG: hypothetical protein LBR07_03550 [Puniceicoccales bacterium]|jgi:tetratricopeptide (TPR) repeat protein|nr:hypothetical protein [Puniceicoccales bacterium]